MAASCSGARISAVATAKTVTGRPRSVNRRWSRRKPARRPSSSTDRTFQGRGLARPGRCADHIGEEGLRSGVAMEDAVLAAFLVVEHELDGDTGAAGPVRTRGIGAVADHVPGIAHGRDSHFDGPAAPVPSPWSYA